MSRSHITTVQQPPLLWKTTVAFSTAEEASWAFILHSRLAIRQPSPNRFDNFTMPDAACGFFQHGLRYDGLEDPECLDLEEREPVQGIYRTVIIQHLPPALVLSDILSVVRGGSILQATMLDTRSIMEGMNSVRLVFLREDAASQFTAWFNENANDLCIGPGCCAARSEGDGDSTFTAPDYEEDLIEFSDDEETIKELKQLDIGCDAGHTSGADTDFSNPPSDSISASDSDSVSDPPEPDSSSPDTYAHAVKAVHILMPTYPVSGTLINRILQNYTRILRVEITQELTETRPSHPSIYSVSEPTASPTQHQESTHHLGTTLLATVMAYLSFNHTTRLGLLNVSDVTVSAERIYPVPTAMVPASPLFPSMKKCMDSPDSLGSTHVKATFSITLEFSSIGSVVLAKKVLQDWIEADRNWRQGSIGKYSAVNREWEFFYLRDPCSRRFGEGWCDGGNDGESE